MTESSDFPVYDQVPLPVPVDDWVIEHVQRRGVSFEQLAREALDRRPKAFGEDLADQITMALILAFEDTGGEVSFEDGWRRVPPRSPEQEAEWQKTQERWAAGARKYAEVVGQMKARSGPFYERSRDLSRVLSDAWRKAGSPREVRRVGGFRGEAARYYTKKHEPATEDEWLAWSEWTKERERIRQQLGVSRVWNSKSVRRGTRG